MIDYLEDIKNYDGLKKYNSSIKRMMKRYELEKGSYEYSKWVKPLFDSLQWKTDTKDIITPFWKLFSAALVCVAKNKEYYGGKWKIANVRPTYVFKDNNIYYRTEYDKRDNKIGNPIKKSTIGAKYLEGDTVHTAYIDAVMSEFNELFELAKITDSMANFAPCPGSPFNTLKGFLPDVSDFLNLMVDKIQVCFEEKKDICYVDYSGNVYTANVELIEVWHSWFLKNREKYYLQDYYNVIGDKLISKKLFTSQSLDHPLPLTCKEIHECAENLIKIIRNRAMLMKMIKILFICHGNICRSPMGECILKDMVKARGIADQFVIDSCATSTEEIGNPIYPPARRELERHGVTLYHHSAVQLKKSDYDRYDLFLCMDGMNVRNTLRIFGDDPQNKVRRLLKDRDVSDPWYTDRFDVAYADIIEGCEALLDEICGKN